MSQKKNVLFQLVPPCVGIIIITQWFVYFSDMKLYFILLIKRIYGANEDERQDILDTSSTFYVNIIGSFSFTGCKKWAWWSLAHTATQSLNCIFISVIMYWTFPKPSHGRSEWSVMRSTQCFWQSRRHKRLQQQRHLPLTVCSSSNKRLWPHTVKNRIFPL